MLEKNDISPETARSLVELTLAEGDKARMNDLARKDREGVLTDDERKELASMGRSAISFPCFI
jgi:hypothetical protein